MTTQNKQSTTSDLELRAMRDAVYGTNPDRAEAEKNWDACKENWRKDEAWLREQWQKQKGE